MPREFGTYLLLMNLSFLQSMFCAILAQFSKIIDTYYISD